MARWHEDDVDRACASWAHQWVEGFGKSPDRASRSVGPLGCTLGRVRELHDGASSNTGRDRAWPEVFLGQGLLVAIALQAMTLGSREIVWAHYVGRVYNPVTWAPLKRPLKQRLVAERLGVSLAEYYHRRDTAKSCVRTVLCLDTIVLASTPGLTVQVTQAG